MGPTPMFPLESALLPGEKLPLRIFEPRYSALVGTAWPVTDRAFGVVLIERGREVGGGDDAHDVGALARIAEFEDHGDGRYRLRCDFANVSGCSNGCPTIPIRAPSSSPGPMSRAIGHRCADRRCRGPDLWRCSSASLRARTLSCRRAGTPRSSAGRRERGKPPVHVGLPYSDGPGRPLCGAVGAVAGAAPGRGGRGGRDRVGDGGVPAFARPVRRPDSGSVRRVVEARFSVRPSVYSRISSTARRSSTFCSR